MNIQEHISLKEYTTFRIGGTARYFVRVKQIEEVQITLAFAREKKIPVFVLGGGSNILVSDEGFPGLVLKVEIGDIDINQEKDGGVVVSAGAGVDWDEFVAYTVNQGLSGLENLSLIPGTVGAAPVQNIGAYGAEVKNVIEWVEAINIETGKMQHFYNEECQFSYRNSFFKTPEGKKFVITRVGFTLSKNATPHTSYRDVAEYIATHKITDISPRKVRDIVVDIRTKKLPSIKEYGTAGSFFKNPIVSQKTYDKLVEKYPALPKYPGAEGNVKIPAAWILDNLCGFKGFRDGDVGVYKNQALVLINFGKANAHDIKKLADKMILCVKEKTGIILEREVEYI